MGYFLSRKKRQLQSAPTERRQPTRPSPPPAISWLHDVYASTPWLDKTCVILGGGPSILDIDDFSFVQKYRSIAVNKSFMLCKTDIVYSMDTRFYAWLTNGKLDMHSGKDIYAMWRESMATKVFLDPVVDGSAVYKRKVSALEKEVVFVRRSKDDSIARGVELGIYGANNSLFGAVTLAIAMGVSTIYLLGADLSCKERTHWHDGYPDQDINSLRGLLAAYVSAFDKYATTMLSLANIHVVGDSALNCFPKCKLEAIK